MASRKDAQIVFELHHLKHSPEKNFILLSPEKLKTWQSTHSLIIDHIPSPQLPIHPPLFLYRTKERRPSSLHPSAQVQNGNKNQASCIQINDKDVMNKTKDFLLMKWPLR